MLSREKLIIVWSFHWYCSLTFSRPGIALRLASSRFFDSSNAAYKLETHAYLALFFVEVVIHA
jgi:hypothetical protein